MALIVQNPTGLTFAFAANEQPPGKNSKGVANKHVFMQALTRAVDAAFAAGV